MKKVLFWIAVVFTLVSIAFTYHPAVHATSPTVQATSVAVQKNICTEHGKGHDGDLFHSVRGFIGMLGKPLCFQFLRWHYKDALVDVAKFQTVLAIDVVKQDMHTNWSNSTRLARCRAFYPDGFTFQGQNGFIRSYTSPDGPFTTELGVNSCFIRAVVAVP